LIIVHRRGETAHSIFSILNIKALGREVFLI